MKKKITETEMAVELGKKSAFYTKSRTRINWEELFDAINKSKKKFGLDGHLKILSSKDYQDTRTRELEFDPT